MTAIDRDALIALIVEDSEHRSWSAERFADAILALVPADGITLTRDEAATVIALLHAVSVVPMIHVSGTPWHTEQTIGMTKRYRALAERLEASLEPRT